jgi:uncharacterized protein (DUF58 family)
MAHQAWLIILAIVLGVSFMYNAWWRWTRGGRAVNRQIRAQAQRDMEAQVAAQFDEDERRGHTGRVRALTAEEIAEIQRKYGPHVHVRSVTNEQAAEMNERYGRHYRRHPGS